LNDLEQVAEPFILVLDDYHCIKETAVHDLLVELLRYPSPMMHLAVLTRRDPALHISALRVRDQLTEITVKHLRFTIAETQAFLKRFLHVPIDEDTASVMEEKIEGWVTGLRLTALSISQTKDLNNTLQGLKQGSYYIQEYLIQEVLSQVPPVFSRYLMETSILDRFSALLCDALHSLNGKQKESGDELSGQAFIDWLEETHLFAIPLDETHTWFRYHHLFQEILQRQLKRRCSSEEIATLHSRAIECFEADGLVDEALKHSLAAKDVERAAQIVERNGRAIMNDAHSTSQPLVESLTSREIDILERLSQRLQNKEIAEDLCISPETVKSHLNNIYQKLNVSNRREAVEQAKKLGIF
jgi:ATP/maltotriose-dependent transcriptional regulator MalT